METIIAEKIRALISHGDIYSRSKDVYDLAFLRPKADADTLCQPLERCNEFQETELPTSFTRVLKSMNPKSLERGWIRATASVFYKPKFQGTFEAILGLIDETENPS